MKRFLKFLSWIAALLAIVGSILNFCDSPLIRKLISEYLPEFEKICHGFFNQYLLAHGVPESCYLYFLICTPLLLLIICYMIYSFFAKLVDAFYHIKKGSKVGEIWPVVHDGLNFKFVWIPSGHFMMGISSKDTPAKQKIAPRHRVKLTEGFWVLQGPVNQLQWAVLMNDLSRVEKGKNSFPVENITWNEARNFCARFKKKVLEPKGFTGMDVRLLTEAEWEYASRAGHDFENEKVIQKMAWFGGNSGGQTHPVGSTPKRQNDFGLYDTHGNVREFVLDFYSNLSPKRAKNPQGPDCGAYHVVRGGGFKTPTVHECLSGFRDRIPAGTRSDDVGFRFAIVVKKK